MIYGKSLVYEEFCGPCLSLWEDENGVKKCDIQMQSSMDKEKDKEEVELKKKMGKESTLHSVPKTHVYPRTPDSSEGLIPRAIIWYMGIDP